VEVALALEVVVAFEAELDEAFVVEVGVETFETFAEALIAVVVITFETFV
jgi:hypothetical protein